MRKKIIINFFIFVLTFIVVSNLYSTDVSGNISTNTTWELSGSPYNIVGTVTIYSGASLNIESGVTVNFTNDGYILQVGSSTSSTGILIADNVTFTCLDVNDARIRILENSDATLSNCTFDHTRLQLDNVSPTITNNRLKKCSIAVLLQDGATPTFNNNDLYNNTTALKNESTTLAICENNYWGHMSGPQHTSNPAGEGEEIEGNVDIIPFASSPFNGVVTANVLKTSINYGIVTVNAPVDSIIKITSEGNIDVLVTKIESDNDAFFITSETRFWTEYQDTNNIVVRFVATEDKEYSGTLTIYTNDPSNPEFYVALTGTGTGASSIETLLPGYCLAVN